MLGWIFLVSLSWFQIYSRNVCGEEALNFVTIQSCLFNCQDAHCMQRNMSNILRYIWNICGGKPPSIRGVLIEVAIRWSPNQLTYLPSLIWLLDKYISQFRLIVFFSKFTAYGKSHFPQFFLDTSLKRKLKWVHFLNCCSKNSSSSQIPRQKWKPLKWKRESHIFF